MNKWLHQPLLSLLLLVSWQLLVQTYTSVGHWLLGAILALVIPRLLYGWWKPVKIKSWKALSIFFMRVFVDIIEGNLLVAKWVLGKPSKLKPCFVEFETQLKNDLAIFMLKGAIAIAPGSVPTNYVRSSSKLRVHVLHTEDPQAFVNNIKQRYEELLLEVFYD